MHIRRLMDTKEFYAIRNWNLWIIDIDIEGRERLRANSLTVEQ